MKNFFGIFRRRAAPPSPDPGWATARRVTGVVQNSDPYTGHVSVYRCVRVIVGAVQSAPLVAKQGQGSNGTILEAGPWSDFLLRPNPLQTRREFVEAFLTYLLIAGETGIYLEGADGPAMPGEIPEEAWPLPGRCLTEIVDERSKIVVGWRIVTATGQIEVPADAVVFLRFFNPSNPVRGLSPLTAAATGLRSDLKAEAWGEAFFDNSAEPGGILSTDGSLTKDQRREMRESWEERHRGVDRRGRVAVLEGGLKYQATGIPQRDMEYLEQRRWNETQIAKVYGVPKFFLMAQEDISYASTRQAKRALWELTILPLLATIEDVFEARLTGTRNADVWLEFDRTQVEALRDDLDANLTAAEKMTRLGYPLNEVNERLELGMRRQPWGDQGLLPMGVAPAETVASGEALAGGTEAPDSEDPNADPSDDPLPQVDKPPETEKETVEPVRGVAPIPLEEPRARRSRTWQRLERAVLRPATGRFRRRIEGWMNGRRSEILRVLGTLLERSASRAVSPEEGQSLLAYLKDAEERWAKMLRKQTAPLYRQIAEQAANGISKELGGLSFFTMGDPAIGAFLAEKQMKVVGVSSTVIRALRETIAKGLGANEDVNSLQDRVRQVFTASRNRSLTIARTEVAQATNGARQVVMTKEGVESVEWLTADDEFVRDETLSNRVRPKANHRALDGEIRKIGETFVPGIELHYPGDVRAPAPWVVNCRCVTAPVRKDRASRVSTVRVETSGASSPEGNAGEIRTPSIVLPPLTLVLPKDSIRVEAPRVDVKVDVAAPETPPPPLPPLPTEKRVTFDRDPSGRITGARIVKKEV